MIVSPVLFDRLGWRGVANATPQILLFGGTFFFAAAVAYQHWFGSAAAAAAAAGVAAPAPWLLGGLVIGGALLYAFSKGAKFSLFKPAEEMVYITLDEAGRTRGKAAIDVVGAQVGGQCIRGSC
jgi:AAA family ATP:ADP antiporter